MPKKKAFIIQSLIIIALIYHLYLDSKRIEKTSIDVIAVQKTIKPLMRTVYANGWLNGVKAVYSTMNEAKNPNLVIGHDVMQKFMASDSLENEKQLKDLPY